MRFLPSPDGATDYRRGQATRSPRSTATPSPFPLPCANGAGRGLFLLQSLIGGCTPVCILSPPRGLIIPSHRRRKSVCEGTKRRKRPRDICVRQLVIYRSFVYLFKSNHRPQGFNSSFIIRHWQCASLMSLKSLVSLISPRPCTPCPAVARATPTGRFTPIF